MRYFIRASLVVLLVIAFSPFEPNLAQSDADIKRGKKEYEETHPGKKTYFIADIIGLLDPVDFIMPSAKAVTHKRWKEIGGAMFGALVPFDRPASASRDDFTTSYFQEDGKLKQIITEYLLTDVSSFQKFMEEHKKNGYHKVTLWKAGYLMFYMLEGRGEKQGTYFIVVPVKPKLFDKVKDYQRKLQKNP
ncbi:MAG TPA: hypothetical protein VF543_07690 [Pyrinomonadaceae bacterium]|jgi:hypothetical protein